MSPANNFFTDKSSDRSMSECMDLAVSWLASCGGRLGFFAGGQASAPGSSLAASVELAFLAACMCSEVCLGWLSNFTTSFLDVLILTSRWKKQLSLPTFACRLFAIGSQINALIQRHLVREPLFGLVDRYVIIATICHGEDKISSHKLPVPVFRRTGPCPACRQTEIQRCMPVRGPCRILKNSLGQYSSWTEIKLSALQNQGTSC